MRRLGLLALTTACACATPRAEKMSFEELYGSSRSHPPEPTAPPAPLAGAGRAVPQSSQELQAALASFAERARAYRQQVERGGAMPASQAENWEAMNHALDGFLSRPVSRTDSHDVVRARSVLEAELELDGRTYGDMPGALAEAVVLRVGRLAVRMAELRRLEHPAQTDGLPRLAWPLEPVSITSLFGHRWHPVTGQHRRHLGVDLAARQGQVIYTAEKGVVLRAGWNGDHGNQVEVQHAGRWVTRYSHLSRVLVEPGEILERGNAVGLAGETGLATGVHLHFELWRDGQAMDPLDALGADDEAPLVEGPPVARGRTALEPATHQGRRPVGQRP
ncbi:M23 family metallopeptidase [Pyxidicoccus xibeiensis]|uniref:M23 family metallopeptidase n=1 Tax=Pyxidicoccus xibeiensis TaxID=2906759 RepID=UPI0020A6E66A|nr:peptidoglycan DD-metalloendopeptidase family protein [Pyxidicoccus xibeiensis]MCP3138876.1 M23 family metallopeptidase [Pyxidicoccus xibeiensis]